MKYNVSLDELLGLEVEADDPVAAAREAAVKLGAAAGAALNVRWNIVADPAEPGGWLFASLAQVAVQAEWLGSPAAEATAPAPAPAPSPKKAKAGPPAPPPEPGEPSKGQER